jgi:hypothetical protein
MIAATSHCLRIEVSKPGSSNVLYHVSRDGLVVLGRETDTAADSCAIVMHNTVSAAVRGKSIKMDLVVLHLMTTCYFMR